MATPFKMKGGVGSSPAKFDILNHAAITTEYERQKKIQEAAERERAEQEALEQSRTDWD